jgi:RHS repeat-associated protein
VEQIDSSGNVLFLHQDQVGSTRLLTDSTGAVAGTYSYDAYGNTTAHTGTASTPLEWQGQYLDSESGLYYLRARYYDPTTAQFITRDPLDQITGQPYGYAQDDPLNGGDPSGLSAIGDFWNATGGKALHWITHHPVQAAVGAAIAAGTAACVILEPCGVGEAEEGGGFFSNLWSRLADEKGSWSPFAGRTSSNFDWIASRLEQYHGIGRSLASDRLHAIKEAAGLGPADNVLFDRTGNVYDSVTGEWLGSLSEGGGG